MALPLLRLLAHPAHILELNFFGPILRGQGVRVDNGWNEILYQDYRSPNLHIGFFDAFGKGGAITRGSSRFR